MTEFDLKDSGKRQGFDSGAKRDTQDGKSRPDLISVFMRRRLGDVMAKGAEKYDERNWEKGMPSSRYLASAHRHILDFEEGKVDEDHLSQAIFNLGAIIHNQEAIKRGILPAELNDLPDYTERDREEQGEDCIDEGIKEATTAYQAYENELASILDVGYGRCPNCGIRSFDGHTCSACLYGSFA